LRRGVFLFWWGGGGDRRWFFVLPGGGCPAHARLHRKLGSFGSICPTFRYKLGLSALIGVTMNCRNCGAAMQPVGNRVYFRCQHCTTFEFPQTAEDGIVTLEETTQHNCPVCDKQLSSAVMEGHTVNFCGHCRGLLTSNVLFTQILANRRSKNVAPSANVQPIEKTELQRRLSCPQCTKPMDTHPYGGGGAVVVDTCCRCHLIWLDAGEIDDIARHRPHGKPMKGAVLLTSTAGSCNPPDSGWSWGGEPDYVVSDDTGVSLWEVIRRLL
jgi:Zn-finger nucleic acid-binding protein